MSRTVRTIIGMVALGLVAAACGTSTTTSTTTTSTSTSITTAPGKATVGLAIESTSLGSILETASGHTLYAHSNDTANKSNCSAACRAIWPPLTVSATPSFGAGVKTSLVNRVGSTNQLSYGGHPLYTFVYDTSLHQTKGEGIVTFGGTWDVVSSTGKVIATKG